MFSQKLFIFIKDEDSDMKKIQTLCSNIVVEVAGSFLMAVGLTNFAMAARLPLVGFSGIAFLINYVTGIPTGWAIIGLNIPVAAHCWRVLGRGFFVRSMRCMLISSFMIDYLAPLLPVYQGDRLLAALATGVIAGLGFALIYTRNSSTGGMDFITMSIKAKCPHFPLGKINLTFDILIISAGSIIFQDADGMIYGLIVSWLLSVVVDKVIFGINSGKMALIITEHGDTICQVIEDTCHRGSTILPGWGGYQKTEKQIVMSVCSSKQMVELQQAVSLADPSSFTIILDSSEVHGDGFRTVRFGDLHERQRTQ